jgi:hypothetical protein
MPRLRRRTVGLFLVVAAAACGGDDDGAGAEEARQVGIYAAVVLDVADDLTVEPDGEPTDRVVFVEPLEPADPIAIEVQAGVVAELEDRVEVSFIDDRDEAVDRELAGRPVREGAALIGLGRVPRDDDPAEVEVQRYEREGRVEELLVTVARDGDAWAVVARRPAD